MYNLTLLSSRSHYVLLRKIHEKQKKTMKEKILSQTISGKTANETNCTTAILYNMQKKTFYLIMYFFSFMCFPLTF